MRKNEKGLTLIEVMFSVFIAILVLVGVVQALIYIAAMTSDSKSRAMVFQDVQMTMERVSGTPLSSLVTTFPNNQALPNAFVTNVLQGYKLTGENITVSYPAGTGGNPLEVVVTGQWPERGQTRSVVLRTFRRG